MKKSTANAYSIVHDLNNSPVGCVPCRSEVLNIERKIGLRKLSDLKINEIKKIVDLIFEPTKNDY